jgi:hypothetical protein
MDSQEKVQQRVRFTSHAHQLKQRKFVCVANGRCLAYLKKLKELLDRAIGFTVTTHQSSIFFSHGCKIR